MRVYAFADTKSSTIYHKIYKKTHIFLCTKEKTGCFLLTIRFSLLYLKIYEIRALCFYCAPLYSARKNDNLILLSADFIMPQYAFLCCR